MTPSGPARPPVARASLALASAFLAAAAVAGVRPSAHAPVAADDAPLFDVVLGSPSYGGGAVEDLDGDGEPEVLFGSYYNDERVLALNRDGSTLWELSSGGGPVDGSVTAADLTGDGRPEVLWGNAESTRFHVADAMGKDIWSTVIGEVLDAPAAIGDVNGDGRLDVVLASCGAKTGAGGLRAFTGSTGARLWVADTSGCYQSAPLLFDQDGDGRLDVVVSTWFDNKVRAFAGATGRMRWEAAIGDWTYHAGSFGDLNEDGVADVALGDYSATLWSLDGATGEVLWSAPLPHERYVFGPTAMGDLDGDGALEIVVGAGNLHAFSADGVEEWSVELPGYATRGPGLLDQDGDGLPDILVACDGPVLQVRSGRDGAPLFERKFAPAADMDFHPTIADLDGDGLLDAFAVYGRGQSDTPAANWGRAVAVHLGARGPSWPTYSHDHHHSGNYGNPPGGGVNPGPTRAPSATATATATPTIAAPRPAVLPRVDR